jgi:hypothetical protein
MFVSSAGIFVNQNVDYDSPSPSEGSRRYRRELLERIRQELFTTAEQEPSPVEQRLLRQVASIIQRCENELLATYNTSLPDTIPGFLHPPMPTHRRASAPSILPYEQAPSQSQPSLPPPDFPNAPDYTSTINTPLEPPQNGSVDPRSTGDLNGISEPAGNAAFPPGEPRNIFPEPFPFSSQDWIDWSFLFPPGMEVQDGDRANAHPTLVPPVWT